MAVAALGDAALAAFAPAAVFTGHQTEEGHELARVLEAAQIAQFADESHGGDFLEALAGHERLHHRFPFPVSEQLLHFVGEAVPAARWRSRWPGCIPPARSSGRHRAGRGRAGTACGRESSGSCRSNESRCASRKALRRCLARARSSVASVRARHTSRTASSRAGGTRTSVMSPLRKSLAMLLGIALIRLDPLVGLRSVFEGDMTTQCHAELAQAPGEDEAGGSGFIADMEFVELDAELLGPGPAALVRRRGCCRRIHRGRWASFVSLPRCRRWRLSPCGRRGRCSIFCSWCCRQFVVYPLQRLALCRSTALNMWLCPASAE